MTQKYAHQEIEKEVLFPAGYYTPRKEVRLKYNGREVLYIAGYVVVDASCCGAANWAYVLVPGYIVHWQHERNENDLPITDVEPVKEETAKDAIRKLIREAENIQPIEFW